jgi:hypothetical protein
MSSGSGDAKVQDGSAADEFWGRERAWQIGELEKPFTVSVRAPVPRGAGRRAGGARRERAPTRAPRLQPRVRTCGHTSRAAAPTHPRSPPPRILSPPSSSSPPPLCVCPQVSDPRTEGGALTSYTTYHISSTLSPDGVRRRYSDFDWLRDILVARYHGIAVPLMPEKRLVGNQSKSFIEERMQARTSTATATYRCCSQQCWCAAVVVCGSGGGMPRTYTYTQETGGRAPRGGRGPSCLPFPSSLTLSSAPPPPTAAPLPPAAPQGLENFLLLVLANPYMRADVTLRMYLTVANTVRSVAGSACCFCAARGRRRIVPPAHPPHSPPTPPLHFFPRPRLQAEFEQGKKAHTSGVGADPSTNAGLRQWFGVLRHLPLPLDADAAASELASFVDDSEAKVTAALAAVTRYYEAAKSTTDSLRSLRDALADWHTGCTTASGALSETLSPVRSSLAVLGVRLKKGCDAFSNVYDLSVFAPNEVQIFLMDGLVTEIHRLRSLKALLGAFHERPWRRGRDRAWDSGAAWGAAACAANVTRGIAVEDASTHPSRHTRPLFIDPRGVCCAGVREGAKKAYSGAWFAQDKLQFQAKQVRSGAGNARGTRRERGRAQAPASHRLTSFLPRLATPRHPLPPSLPPTRRSGARRAARTRRTPWSPRSPRPCPRSSA